MQRIAVLGLGTMGSGMAHNLVKAGFGVTVWNRTAARTEPLAAAGATVAATPREAAAGAAIIVSMVSDDAASRATWLGDDGALAGAEDGATLLESSTLTLAWVHELADAAAARGLAFLDAPVRGSKPQAEAGELQFLVGGSKDALETVRPALEAMGKRIDHLGPVGSGATMKLINNLMGGVQIAVLAEGLLLAERSGLEMDQVVRLLINGAPGSPIVKGKAARIVAQDYRTDFALRWMHKDLSYALEEAVAHSVAMPTVAAAREVYRLAMARGHADEDFAAVVEALR